MLKIQVYVLAMCGFRKYPHPSCGSSLKILRGCEVSKAENFKGKYYLAKLEFSRGVGGFKPKRLSVGRVWIFSEATQWEEHVDAGVHMGEGAKC